MVPCLPLLRLLARSRDAVAGRIDRRSTYDLRMRHSRLDEISLYVDRAEEGAPFR